MDLKYSNKTQSEIDELLNKLNIWEKFFKITLNYFYEGWAIYLRERALYPRLIVIFKPYLNKYYSISSFEIHNTENNKEVYKKLYINEKIQNTLDLVSEFNKILYGKDICSSLLSITPSQFEK